MFADEEIVDIEANNVVDVYNTSFQKVSLGAGAFTDPNAPEAGMAAFNAQNINGNTFVTYAAPGPFAATQEL